MFKGVGEEQRVHGRRGVGYTHIKQCALTYKQLHTDSKIEKNEKTNSESVGAGVMFEFCSPNSSIVVLASIRRA